MIPFLDLKKINAAYQVPFQLKLNEILDKGWFILGDEVRSFESNFAAYCGTKHCIGVGNGLDALTLIFKSYIQLGKIELGVSYTLRISLKSKSYDWFNENL